MKEIIDSFRDTIKTRIANPFFGTLTLVWLLTNWKLFFYLFNFDSNLSMDERMKLIEPFFITPDFYFTLGECALKALAIVLISYIFLGLSRLLSNAYFDWIVPFLKRITYKNGIALKSEVTDMREKYSKAMEMYEVERNRKNELISIQETIKSEIKILETQLSDFRKELKTEKEKNQSFEITKMELNETIKQLSSELSKSKEKINLEVSRVDSINKFLDMKDDEIHRLSDINKRLEISLSEKEKRFSDYQEKKHNEMTSLFENTKKLQEMINLKESGLKANEYFNR